MSLDEIIEHRKYLHQHPELSGKETATSEYIQQVISSYLPKATITNVAGHGLIANIDGTKKGKHVLLRAELDALPIQESNKFAHRSTRRKVSHKCGHDGHMAILLAVAQHFSKNKLEKGRLSLLFQPAEETGEGAKAVIQDETFTKNFKPDYTFALHNVPGYPKNTILCKENSFTPSVTSIKVKFFGKTSHAAEPQFGINPSYAIADLLKSAKILEDTNPSSRTYGLITPIHIKVGSEDYGIAAGFGEADFTLRTWKTSSMKNLREKFMSLIIDVSRKHHLDYKLDWFQEFHSISNAKEAVQFVKKSSKQLNLNYINKKEPFPWGEDFGLFTASSPGAMFAIGAGRNTPALHNPDYDFPDEIIQTAKSLLISIYNEVQKDA